MLIRQLFLDDLILIDFIKKSYTMIAKLQESPMTWARLLGLIQSDGNFYFTVDEDKTLRPKITVSVTKKRDLFIKKIRNFLILEGFSPNMNESKDGTHATNIAIVRIAQCERFLEKINLLEKEGISLVGQKKLDCEILKQVIHLNNTGKAVNGSRTLETKLKLVDLKNKLSAKSLEKKVHDDASASALAQRLGVNNWENSAHEEWVVINNKTTEQTDLMISLSAQYKGNSKNIPQALGEFVSGTWEGDGSFQISIKSHVAADGGPVIVKPKGKSPWKRRFIEIKPEFNYTTYEQNSNTIDAVFIISENLFGSKPKQVSKVSKDKKADRYYFKSVADINKYMLPFFERFPPSYERSLNRFRAVRIVARAYKKILNSKIYHNAVVKFILNSPFFSGEEVRLKSYEDYLNLINKQFNK